MEATVRMRICPRIRRLLSGVLVALLAMAAARVRAQAIWFAPPDNLARPGIPPRHPDYPGLFAANAVWDARVGALLIPQFYAARAPDQDLLRIGAWLRQHRIALGVATGTAIIARGECGPLEGLTVPAATFNLFRRLHRLGLAVQYVGMDEPLTFGHIYHAARACRLPIPDLARRVASAVAEIRIWYPAVRIVDYEAITAAPEPEIGAILTQWVAAYRAAVGAPPYAIIADLNWRLAWRPALQQMVAIAHRDGVRAGVFLDGTGPGVSSAAWVAAAQRNTDAVVAMRLPLDILLVANWTIHPRRALPAQDPATLTHFLGWVLARHGGPG
ncbi:MAG TPA: hypothetical protein VHY76_06630 [Acetobacteraceae bacterium]|nr:hypothetical protein [Acetobacteraceae bacterium]